MLWFSIPVVILLASIPMLVIVYQIEDFNMCKYFTWYNINILWCYMWAAYAAFNGDFLFVAIQTILCACWCFMDSQEKDEWK